MALPAYPAGWRIKRDSWPIAAVVAVALAGAGDAAAQTTTYIGSGGGSGVVVDPSALDRLGPRQSPGHDTLALPFVIESEVTLTPPAPDAPPPPSWPTYAEPMAPQPPPPPPPPEPMVAALPTPPAEPVPAQPLPGAEPLVEPVVEVPPEPVAEPQATAEPEPQPEAEAEAATALVSPPSGVPDLTLPGPLFSIGFAADESDLRPESAASLDSLVSAMAADATARVQLVAYAGSSTAGASAARRLSLSRALAVRAFLIERGIRSTRIDVRALGAKTDGGPPDRVDIVALPR